MVYIQVIVCLLFSIFLRVDAHGFATPKPLINYTIPLGTRPVTCQRFVQKSNSDLATCDGRVYRSSIHYCYTSKSRIRLKKCQRICGGGSDPEIKLCEEMCPTYSTCNWGRRDENETKFNCEEYYDYLDKFTTTTAQSATTTAETESTTQSSRNSSEVVCTCTCPPSYAFFACIIGILLVILVFVILVFIIYLVFQVRQLDRSNSHEGGLENQVESQRRVSRESHSRSNPLSQEDDVRASQEVSVNLAEGTSTYHRDKSTISTTGQASETSPACPEPSPPRNESSSFHGPVGGTSPGGSEQSTARNGSSSFHGPPDNKSAALMSTSSSFDGPLDDDGAALIGDSDTDSGDGDPTVTELDRLLSQDRVGLHRRSHSAPDSKVLSSAKLSQTQPDEPRTERVSTETTKPYY